MTHIIIFLFGIVLMGCFFIPFFMVLNNKINHQCKGVQK